LVCGLKSLNKLGEVFLDLGLFFLLLLDELFELASRLHNTIARVVTTRKPQSSQLEMLKGNISYNLLPRGEQQLLPVTKKTKPEYQIEFQFEKETRPQKQVAACSVSIFF